MCIYLYRTHVGGFVLVLSFPGLGVLFLGGHPLCQFVGKCEVALKSWPWRPADIPSESISFGAGQSQGAVFGVAGGAER